VIEGVEKVNWTRKPGMSSEKSEIVMHEDATTVTPLPKTLTGSREVKAWSDWGGAWEGEERREGERFDSVRIARVRGDFARDLYKERSLAGWEARPWTFTVITQRWPARDTIN
jgi:hypothetical protein